MSARVDYSEGGDFGLLFGLNGKVFGFASFNKRLHTSSEDLLLLSADFVIDSEIKRLSKLVLYLLMSNEVQDIISHKLLYVYEGFQTAVYTDKPVSMKYRGAFELLRRDKGKLVYVGKFNGLSLKENYERWLKNQK